ncbi:glycosyltransferase family 4 protein [Plantactinospora siamensis]|uniref:Glycosyltransferase family 4 protein n=1 Tax=Plantactinospora siamensis TaxID=555372 RepID=A0ABV6P5L3_9ACTN
MHVMITAVGARTEHWMDLFAVLAAQPDLTVTVVVADVSATARQELAAIEERTGLRYHVLAHRWSEGRTGHMASVLFDRDGLRSVAERDRPDVLHLIGESSYLSTWQMLRLRRRWWPRVPVTLYAAQNVVMRLPVPFPLLERHAYRSVDHALPITPAALAVLRAKGYHGPATIVPLGVDTARFAPAPVRAARSRPFTAGFVGRLEPHKGIRDLLCAGELLDCDLLLVGDGSLRPEVERAAARRPGRVTLRDWADHATLPGLIGRMDALVLPSVELVQRNVLPWVGIPLREQFGRVLVEAMACEVPVVGSEVGEIPYVIGPAGLTYPAGNATALVDRLAQLRDDPELARKFAALGRERAVGEFGWDRIAQTLCRIWSAEHDRARFRRRTDGVLAGSGGATTTGRS